MLEEQGFVRRAPQVGAQPAGAATPAAPPSAAIAPAAAAPQPDLPALRRRVVRLLLDAIGPHGDELALRLERSRSLDELRALIPAAASVVEAVAGRGASASFLERVARL